MNGEKLEDYLNKWSWDVERFDGEDPLPDLARRLQTIADKIDVDIRGFLSSYTEKKQTLAALARRQTGTLMVVALEDLITPALLEEKGTSFLDTEFFSTQVIVIQKTAEEAFLKSYEFLDEASVPYGPAGDRDSILGSPVVPRSACRLLEDKEGYVLYTVVVLKKYVESFRNDCRSKKFPVRDFTYVPEHAGSGLSKIEKLEADLQETLSHLQDQCVRKFADVFSVWLHLKAIRVFVESVLRYGLPVNFVAALIKPGRGADKKLHELLHTAYAHLAGDSFGDGGDEGSGKRNPGAAALGMGSDADFHPYVFLPLSLPAGTTK